MKTIAFSLLALLTFTGVSLAEDSASPWMTDYQAALAKSKESGKPILADFTGSDWCVWCKRLDAETFEKPAFLDFAKDNLVLLEVDFPQQKEQSAELKTQNEKLGEEFKVEGYPTLVLIGSDGKEITRNVGYLPGGPDAMIAWVEKATKK